MPSPDHVRLILLRRNAWAPSYKFVHEVHFNGFAILRCPVLHGHRASRWRPCWLLLLLLLACRSSYFPAFCWRPYSSISRSFRSSSATNSLMRALVTSSPACRASARYFMIFISSSTRSFLWAMKRAS